MGATPRQLAYKDRFVWELEQTVSAIFDDCNGLTDRVIFPDMNTRIPLVMYLSQVEFTQLYTAVLTGADLSYPDTSHDIEYLFLQTVGCTMSQLCEALADCILNNASTRLALDTWAAETGQYSGGGNILQPLDDAILQEDLVAPDQTCDNDHIFGLCYALVDAINEATTEVLQAIEILTNPLEIMSELGDNFPGAGLAFSAVDVANYMQNTAAEAYDLAWSPTIRDELACIFFCIVKDDCTISLERIKDQYLITSGHTPPVGETLEEWLVWLIALALPSSLQNVATISLMGILAMEYGGRFGTFILGIRTMEQVLDLAKDDTDSNWDVLCIDCAETATPVIAAGCYGGGSGGTLLSLGGDRWRLTMTEVPSQDWRGTIKRDNDECFTMANVVDNRTGVKFHGWLPCIGPCANGFNPPPYSSDWLEFGWTSNNPGNIEFDFLLP